MGKATSTAPPERMAEMDCAGNPSQERKDFPPYKLTGESGGGGRIFFAGKSELTKFQARKR